MSDALRDLIVSIDFKEVDVAKLTKMDKAVDTIETNINHLGVDIKEMGGQTGIAAADGKKAMDKIGHAADDAGKEMNKLGNAAKEAGKDASAGTNKFLDSLNGVVPQGRVAGGAAILFSNPWVIAGAAVVGAIGGVALAITNMVNDADKAYDRLSAKTGITGDELQNLKGAALAIYSEGFGDSLPAITDDLAKIRAQFKDLDQGSMEHLTMGAMMLRDLFGPEVAQTSKTIKTMTTNFKDLNADKALDLITFAFQKGGDYADDLLDTVNEYSSYFARGGHSAEEFIGILLRGSEAGAFNLDKVGDAVKEFGIRAVDGSDQTSDAFKQLGFDSKKMSKDIAGGGPAAEKAFQATIASLSFVDDKVKQNMLGVMLFGTQWEDMGKNVIFSMNDASKAVDGFKDSTDKAITTMNDNAASKWTTFTRGIKTAFQDAFDFEGDGAGSGVIDTLMEKLPAVQAGIQGFAVGVKGVVDWFTKMFTDNKETIDRYITDISAFFSGFVSLVTGLWTVFGPLITDTLSGALNVIWNITGTVLGAIGDIFSIFGNLLQGNWGAAWQSVKDLFNGVMNGVINTAGAMLDLLFSIFHGTIGRVVDSITGVDLSQAGHDMIAGLVRGVMGAKDWAVGQIKELAHGIWDGFTDFFGIHSPSRLMMEGGQYVVEGLTVGIDKTAQDAIDAARNMSTEVANVATPTMAVSGGQTSGNGNGSLVVNAPITVHVPPGTAANDAQGIAEAVQEAVNATLAKIFTQLNIQTG